MSFNERVNRTGRHPLSLVVVILAAIALAAPGLVAQTPANSPLAAADQLKSQAFKALREGQFERTNALLSEASRLSPDPELARMVRWTGEFEAQRKQFAAERRKEFDKTVADAHKLLAGGKQDYALAMVAKAYPLSGDKDAFRAEPWVAQLLKSSVAAVEKYDQGEQWIRSLRLYSDLSAIEQSNPLWKEKLKQVTRRIRLLALYTPAELRAAQDVELKEREEIEAILKPATGPAATRPATNEASDTFRIDWNDSLRGVKMEMLTDALVDTVTNYYRETTYRDLLTGGLKGLQILATTRGLEKTFPNLAQDHKRGVFLLGLKDQLVAVAAANNPNDVQLLSATLAKLRTLNRETVALPENVLVSEFADGAFAELDPFTGMIWPSDLEEFQKTTQGEFSGVGIQIQSGDDGSLKVVSPLEDSPAYRAGVKAGDIITHINGKSAKGITLNQAVKNITGPSGTTVTLTVKGPRESRDLMLRRETIKVASIKGWIHRPGGGWDYYVDPQQKIAYIRLTNFTKSTGQDLDAAITHLADDGAKGVIIDLRYNPGGRLDAAIEVADTFLGNGVIVSTRPDRRTPNQPQVASAKKSDEDSKVPVVVLVNQYSASASEIVSGALKDQHRAMIVGERTFGKGSVQMLFPLSNQTAYLKLTTSHYYLPSGRCIHREENSKEWGVDPDVTIEMTPEQMRQAIDARQELDVLRDADAPDAPKKAPATGPATAKSKDPLANDAQLSAALLLLRLQVAGAAL